MRYTQHVRKGPLHVNASALNHTGTCTYLIESKNWAHKLASISEQDARAESSQTDTSFLDRLTRTRYGTYIARRFIKKYGTRMQGSCGEGTADGTTIDCRIIPK